MRFGERVGEAIWPWIGCIFLVVFWVIGISFAFGVILAPFAVLKYLFF